ncbi:MAG TPA: hypothetical protein VE010_02730 [Thermoanaerobaculia bacterium]|nr:hypothetical protein [Thermoanaerobaculia bacterium]
MIGDGEEQHYTIRPHYAAIRTPKDDIDIPHHIENGTIVRGVRLQIVNAIGPLCYDDFEALPALDHYVEHYRPSAEVVHGGRAQCYFDLFSGHVTTELIKKERHAVITIHTKGKPLLQISPLVVESPVPHHKVWRIPLDSHTLTFMNASRNCPKRSSLDFLLNYLTGEGGIPHAVTADFPAEEWHPDASQSRQAQRAISEEDLVPPTAEELFRDVGGEGELPMCSDSRYP